MKASVSFVAGLAVGAVSGMIAGAAYMKTKIEETIEERVDDEVKKFVDDYFKNDDEDESYELDSEDMIENEADDPTTAYNSLHAFSERNTHKPDPTKIFRDPLAEHPEEPEEEKDIFEESPVKRQAKEDESMKDPRLISEDKFDEDDDYEKETLYYYNEDDVLTDENENEVDNELYLIGDAMDKYDFRNSEERIIHVRNYELQTDYEVVKVFAPFRS